MRLFGLTLALFMVSGCSNIVYRDRPVEVLRPVPQPCMTIPPEKVLPLKEKYSPEVWTAMDVKQKAAAVALQGIEHQDYGMDLEVASKGCPLIK